MKKQFRNGTYMGSIIPQTNTLSGLGILIKDTSQLIIGNWQDGKIYGEYVYISESMRAMGKLTSERILQGFQIIQILSDPQSHKMNTKTDTINKIQPMTLYGVFKNNKLFGKYIISLKQYIYICTTNIPQNNIQIIQKIKNNRNQLSQTLSNTFKYIQYFNIHQYLTNIITNTNNTQQNNKQPNIQKYKPIIKKYIMDDAHDHKIFYGFSTNQNPQSIPSIYLDSNHTNKNNHQFGFFLYNQDLISMGEHSNGQPHGLAVLYNYPTNIHNGNFKFGKPLGKGISLELRDHTTKYVYGIFGQGGNQLYNSVKKNYQNKNKYVKVINQGFQWPLDSIRQFRTEIHLTSMFFDPGFCQIGINFPLKDMIKISQDLNTENKNVSEIKKEIKQPQETIKTTFSDSKDIRNNFISLQKKVTPNPNIYSANKIPIPFSSREQTQLKFLTSNKVNKDYTPSGKSSITNNKQYQSLYSNFIKNKALQNSVQKKMEIVSVQPFDDNEDNSKFYQSTAAKNIKRGNISSSGKIHRHNKSLSYGSRDQNSFAQRMRNKMKTEQSFDDWNSVNQSVSKSKRLVIAHDFPQSVRNWRNN